MVGLREEGRQGAKGKGEERRNLKSEKQRRGEKSGTQRARRKARGHRKKPRARRRFGDVGGVSCREGLVALR
jgi:hypothetical protein